MKKMIAYILTIFCAMICFSSCDVFQGILGRKGLNYKEYENCAVFTFDHFPNGAKMSIELDRVNLDEGAIYYQANLNEGALAVHYKEAGYIHEPQPLAEFTADDEMPINGSGGYVEGDEITITFEAYSPVSGEMIIAFTEDALKAVHKNLHLHEHTKKWHASEYAHWYEYTCGCASPDIAEEHIDSNEDGICDICEYYMGITEPKTVFLHECETWISGLTAEGVAEIKTTFEYVGVAPGNFKEVKSTSDKNVIADVLENYKNTTMTTIRREETYTAGGSAFTIEFILTDGTVKKLYFNNGNYIYMPNVEDSATFSYFRMDSIHHLQSEPYDNVKSYLAFIAYNAKGAIYEGGNLICEIPIDEIEFVSLEKVVVDIPTGYVIQTAFGNLIFCTDTVFYMDIDGKDIQYRLINQTVDDLIAQYSEAQ